MCIGENAWMGVGEAADLAKHFGLTASKTATQEERLAEAGRKLFAFAMPRAFDKTSFEELHANEYVLGAHRLTWAVMSRGLL